jgi:hypothetical protein
MNHTELSIYIVLLAGALACSGNPKPAEPEVEWNTADVEKDAGAEGAAPEAAPTLTVEEACARFKTLRDEGCQWTQRFPADFADVGICRRTLNSWVDPSTPKHASLQSTIGCWALNCEAAVSCMKLAQSQGDPATKRACGDEGTTPIEVDADTWDARRGADTKRFADIKTSVSEPVELCGIDGEVEWMGRVTCNDGSNPYESPAAINEGRDGWVENGGRCNSVLDRFTVRCPEAEYTIHIDRYVCPAS